MELITVHNELAVGETLSSDDCFITFKETIENPVTKQIKLIEMTYRKIGGDSKIMISKKQDFVESLPHSLLDINKPLRL